jgi:hypothetical protein
VLAKDALAINEGTMGLLFCLPGGSVEGLVDDMLAARILFGEQGKFSGPLMAFVSRRNRSEQLRREL